LAASRVSYEYDAWFVRLRDVVQVVEKVEKVLRVGGEGVEAELEGGRAEDGVEEVVVEGGAEGLEGGGVGRGKERVGEAAYVDQEGWG